jgi:HAD superfamily hydrolase (TIGR01509 family)
MLTTLFCYKGDFELAKIKLLIFDMDGLMFETGRLAYRAYYQSAIKYDYEMNHNVYYDLTGRTEKAILQEMARLYGNNVPYQEWRNEMNQNKISIFENEKRVYKKKGLVNLLKFAKKNQLTVAVASSNHLNNIEKYLKVEGVSDYIDIIVSGDEVQNGKPNPEIFIRASLKAGVSTQNAFVLEDSLVGIEAAKRAKIQSILVRDDITDLPIKKGKFELLVELSNEFKPTIRPDFVFKDLDEARTFLENIEQ